MLSTAPHQSPAASEATPPIPWVWRCVSKLSAIMWWGAITLASLIFLVWLAIYGLIVPRIDDFRPALENKLSQALGTELRIGVIQAKTEGWIPTFEMTQVRLLDQQGRDALVLRTVTAALSPQSIWTLGFDQLLIEQPELSVRRDKTGRISVAGLDISETSGQNDSPVALDWFFSQREFVIRSGTIRWIDDMRQAPPLVLEKLDFNLRNSGRRHLLRIEGAPPQLWGDRLVLVGDFRSPLLAEHPGDWQTWEGRLYADLPRVDVQELKRYADFGIDVQQGHGALRGWITLDSGQVTDAAVDMALANVDVKLGKDLAPLAMTQLSGRISVQTKAQNFGLRTEQLAFQLRDGLHWPGGNISLNLQKGETAEQSKGELLADKLDLAALAQISDRLPLDASAHQWLQALQPKGLVPNLQASWQGPSNQPRAYQVQGSAVGVSLQASTASTTSSMVSKSNNSATQVWHPGVHQANIDFKFNEKSGQAKLRIDRGSLTLPGVFEVPKVDFDELSTELTWQLDGSHWQAQLAQLKFSNPDAQGEGKAHWQTADPAKSNAKSRFPGILDLQGTLARAEGNKVWRYLPLSVPQDARHYVRDAIVQGKATNGSFKIKGDLFDMPFANPQQGEFRIAAQVSDVTMNYVPQSSLTAGSLSWPALTQISGELVFDRSSMAVKGASAKIASAPTLQLSKVEAQIPDLGEKQVVMVQAQAQGLASDLLKVVTGSPLNALTNQVLARTKSTGNADVKLRLQLPIEALDNSKVQGTITLAGNDLQISPDSPAFQQARGIIGFSEKGFTLRDISARVFGGDIRIDGGSRSLASPNDASVALRAQGVATADGLRQAKELSWLTRIAEQASGSTSYTATLNIRRGFPELAVSSNLQGIALNLPQPLLKTADSILAMRYENNLVRESLSDGSRLQDQIGVQLGNLATINYWRDISAAVPKVIRGRIGVGLAPGEAIAGNDEPGVAANINFAQLDLDAWNKLLSGSTSTTTTSSVSDAIATNTSTASAPTAEVLSYLPAIMSVRARSLTMQGRTLNNVVVGGSRDDLTWRANLDARELNGYVEYRQPSPGNAGRVYARLARLSLAASAANEIEATLEEQPSTIPALDIVVEDFELRGKKLGQVEVEALNRDNAGAREWRLQRLNVGLPEAQFSASGNWTALGASGRSARNERRRTALNFKLDITDSGELLKRFGFDKVIAKGKGRMEGQIAWVGAPWALDYGSMAGGFNVNIEAGQFLKADPGIAKLLGVLSLQSLRRRLGFDFRDVVNEGFSFDFVRGDIKIDQGVASTNNLQMKGVNAAVLMEGSANIAKETQNLRVVVVPEINAGTASLIATAINPAIGLGSFLAQLILRRPVIEAATQEYRVEGSWSDPKLERINRRVTSTDNAAKSAEPQDGAASQK